MQHTQQKQWDVLQQAQYLTGQSGAKCIRDTAGDLEQTSLQATQNTCNIIQDGISRADISLLVFIIIMGVLKPHRGWVCF